MQNDIQRIVISRERISRRVKELADQIIADHAPCDGGRTELTLVAVLSGAIIFCADLMRQMPIDLRLGLVTVSSYPGKNTSTQGPTLLERQLGEIQGQQIVLVDDILDTGRTLDLLVPLLRSAGAADVKTCVLLRKQHGSNLPAPANYVGFDIPDEFVVGYGLDYDCRYRNLPDIVTLKLQVISRRV